MEEYKIPPQTRIGHVHLKVSDLQKSLDFYSDLLGFEKVALVGGQAAFVSAGGYHHHIGANSWRSANAGPRQAGRSGLAHLTLSGSGIARERELVDPWGTIIRMAPGA